MHNQSSDPLLFYSTHGAMTDPGPYHSMYAGLPPDIQSLCQIVQNNMVHIFWADAYGLDLPEDRKQEVSIRTAAGKLEKLLALDPGSLGAGRPLEKRLVGNCRDYSVLLCSLLRHQGVPARARCGFGTYFLPNHFEDHWVCEYWHAADQRWVMVDSQLDSLQQQKLGIDFDPLDVPADRFIVAGKAWQMCRSGAEDPAAFGIFDMSGLWFVRGNLVRDILALNKVEILPWDGGWGLMSKWENEAQEEDWAYPLMDRIAVMSQESNRSFSDVRRLYQSEPGLAPPETWLLESSAV